MRISTFALLALFLISCSKSSIVHAPQQVKLEKTDPVIQKFSDLGSIEKAPNNYNASIGSCSPTLGIYLFIPTYGPFAGQQCEIYRYETETEVLGPCSEEFVFKYEENTLQGQKYIDCPNDGTNCYTFQGPASCVIVFCDDQE